MATRSRISIATAIVGSTLLVISAMSMVRSQAAITTVAVTTSGAAVSTGAADGTFTSPVCTGTGLVRSAVKNTSLSDGQPLRFSIYTSSATSGGQSYHSFCGQGELVGTATSKNIKYIDVNLAAGDVSTTSQVLHTGLQGASRAWGGKSLLSNTSNVSLSFIVHFTSGGTVRGNNFLTLAQSAFGKATGTPSVASAGTISANAGPDQTVPQNTLVHLDGSKSVLGPPGTSTATAPLAQDGLGGRVYSTGQPITVTVLDAEAGFTTDLWILSPAPARKLATNRDVNQAFPVGTYPVGAELIFAIRYSPAAFAKLHANPAQYDTLQSVQFETGPGERNTIDNVAHDKVTTQRPGVVEVSFEDTIGGGDRDYNDNQFDFKGGISAQAGGGIGLQWSIIGQTGPPIQLSSTTALQPTFQATGPGTYVFRLTLTSGTQKKTDDVIVRIPGTPLVVPPKVTG